MRHACIGQDPRMFNPSVLIWEAHCLLAAATAAAAHAAAASVPLSFQRSQAVPGWQEVQT